MTAAVDCPLSGVRSPSPWASPDGRLVLRADAPRADWLARRNTGIGSSDASAVLGLSRWTSAYEVWSEKRGLTQPDVDNDAMELGRLLEPVVVGRWSERTGIPIRKAGLMANRTLPWQLASVDRLAGCGGIVEAKTLSYRVVEEWDDGQTPDHAEAQSQHQMAVTGRSHVHVVGLKDGRTWLERLVVRDDALIADMTKIEGELWQMVLDGVEPPIDGSAATTAVLNDRWPGLVDVEVELGADAVALISERQRANAWLVQAELIKSQAENRLRRLMAEATVGILPDEKRVTFRRNGTFSSKRFVEEQPRVAEAITHPLPALDVAALKGGRPDLYNTYRARVLRIPKI